MTSNWALSTCLILRGVAIELFVGCDLMRLMNLIRLIEENSCVDLHLIFSLQARDKLFCLIEAGKQLKHFHLI